MWIPRGNCIGCTGSGENDTKIRNEFLKAFEKKCQVVYVISIMGQLVFQDLVDELSEKKSFFSL